MLLARRQIRRFQLFHNVFRLGVEHCVEICPIKGSLPPSSSLVNCSITIKKKIKVNIFSQFSINRLDLFNVLSRYVAKYLKLTL